ncbi:helix-turn-helix transcriptional regulator [Sphingobium sp.]|uniref:helix-turn-helix transcriptional regulator n=1 Tax=Sphingobium sp. TaxID=1912891 RepID=UPI0028BF2BD5|nr:helix-turn-helix transcriptional regulator [Sphingobium sp.]
MISSLGRCNFGHGLMEALASICGARHCAFGLLSERQLSPFGAISCDGTDTAQRQFSIYLSGAYWRSDPMMAQATGSADKSCAAMHYARVEDLSGFAVRNMLYGEAEIGERILFCGRYDEGFAILSVLRSLRQGEISEHQMDHLASYSQSLMALVRRHIDLVDSKVDISTVLTSLPLIESILQSADIPLSSREIEVCSRILFGISTAGIALDLNIGEETVMTYRKRAYQRLGIGCQRELLVWYLSRCDEAKFARTAALH